MFSSNRLQGPVLQLVKLPIEFASRQEFRVRSALRDSAFLDQQDLVCFLDGGEAMSNHEGGLPAHKKTQGFVQLPFGDGVQPGSWLVENQDRRIPQECASEGDTLLLAAGEVSAAFIEQGLVSAGQFHDEFVSLSSFSGGHNLVKGGVRPSIGDVLPDGSSEEDGVLRDHADLPAQRLELEPAYVPAIDEYPTLPRVKESGQQPEEG